MNPAVFQTKFQSDLLTANCSIAHLLEAAGSFVVFVWRGSIRVASVALNVGNHATSKQASLDLSTLDRTSQGQPLNTPAESHSVREGAHLVLHVSDGQRGYYVTLCDHTGHKQLWDSRKLGKGDIFSFLALVPGEYSVSSSHAAHATMIVSHSPTPGERQARRAPVYVKAAADRFEPAHWSVSGVQPVVIAAGAAATFAVSLTRAAENTRSKEQMLTMERDRLRQAIAARFGSR